MPHEYLASISKYVHMASAYEETFLWYSFKTKPVIRFSISTFVYTNPLRSQTLHKSIKG